MAHRRSGHRRDFYPRPPRGGRRSSSRKLLLHLVISIHALREEGDVLRRKNAPVGGLISIHALREEGDTPAVSSSTPTTRFLSTPSARRATELTRCFDDVSVISIHALREEGD